MNQPTRPVDAWHEIPCLIRDHLPALSLNFACHGHARRRSEPEGPLTIRSTRLLFCKLNGVNLCKLFGAGDWTSEALETLQ